MRTDRAGKRLVPEMTTTIEGRCHGCMLNFEYNRIGHGSNAMNDSNALPSTIGPEYAGMLLTPREFDAIRNYDENYCYELIHGVLVVNPIPLAEETGPNELLGFHLYEYQQAHPERLDYSLPQQYIRVRDGRRLADRLIWTDLGRLPSVRRDVATIAVEFVSAGKRSRRRDYVEKKREYRRAGLKEYWIIDRFARTLTVVSYRSGKPVQKTFHEKDKCCSALQPGFEIRLKELLDRADALARARRRKSG